MWDPYVIDLAHDGLGSRRFRSRVCARVALAWRWRWRAYSWHRGGEHDDDSRGSKGDDDARDQMVDGGRVHDGTRGGMHLDEGDEANMVMRLTSNERWHDRSGGERQGMTHQRQGGEHWVECGMAILMM